MSRARIVCADILSRMSPVLASNEKDVNSSEDVPNQNRVLNLYIPTNSDSGENSVNGENSAMSCDVPDELQMSVDEWLKQRNIIIETLDGQECYTPMDCDLDENYMTDTKESDLSPQDDSLVLDNVDPLLNMRNGRSIKCELESVSDCDITMSKGRMMWDTLSIASKKSDGDGEANNDFADFNLLSYTLDPNEIDTLATMSENGKNNVKFELDNDISFDIIPSEAPVKGGTNAGNLTSHRIGKSNNPKCNKQRNCKKVKNSTKATENVAPAKLDKNMNVDDEYNILNDTDDSTIFDMIDQDLMTKSAADLNSVIGPILKETLTPEQLALEEKRIFKQHRISEISKTTGSLAIVSNSTVNKAKPRTRMVIKTDKGDERYEGNTAELMQPLGRRKNKAPAPLLGKHIITSVKTAATIKDEVNSTLRYRQEPDDSIVREMLSVLGITDDMLYTVLTHLGLRVWICPEHECRRIFNRLPTLKTHILGHYGLKPFKCDYPNCPWSFYTSFKLKRHRETHLKKKNFTCKVPDCNRSFTTIYNLNTHLKLHERPARLKCLVGSCNNRFQTIRAMEKHLKTHEESLAPYKCKHPGCDKFYFSFSSLNAHSRCHQHKKEELTCQWQGCGRVFDKPCRLKAHMRQHTGDKPYVCNYPDCKWAFSSSSKLKRHQHKHIGERRFRCTIGDCTKAFKRSEHLKDHTLTHIGSRSFQCPYCGESFGAKATLYVHKKKVHSDEVGKKNLNKKSTKNNTLESQSAKEKFCPSTCTSANKNEGKKVSVPLPKSNLTNTNVSTKNISTKDFDLSSEKSEYQTTDNVSPKLHISFLNETEIEVTKESVSPKTPTKSSKKTSRKLKKGTPNGSESCARTYLTYESSKGAINRINSEAGTSKTSDVPLLLDVHCDTSVSDVDSTTLSYTCSSALASGILLSEQSSEMLINSDLLQDSQQPIFLSNLVLQDENGSDLFGPEGSGEYILLLDSSTNSPFSQSTINLRDLD